MNVLISACLLGVPCRYDGASKEYKNIKDLMQQFHLVPVCPEILGGLPTPRKPVETCNGRAVTKDGTDVTTSFEAGADEVLRLAKLYDCTVAILKERSPSCGSRFVYDGTFTGTIIEGNGITAQRLLDHGIEVIGESQIESWLGSIQSMKQSDEISHIE